MAAAFPRSIALIGTGRFSIRPNLQGHFCPSAALMKVMIGWLLCLFNDVLLTTLRSNTQRPQRTKQKPPEGRNTTWMYYRAAQDTASTLLPVPLFPFVVIQENIVFCPEGFEPSCRTVDRSLRGYLHNSKTVNPSATVTTHKYKNNSTLLPNIQLTAILVFSAVLINPKAVAAFTSIRLCAGPGSLT